MDFGLKYHLDGDKQFKTALRDGKWWEEGSVSYIESAIESGSTISVFQYGPDPKRLPPVENSSPDERIVGLDRKSTRLNSSHVAISYAVFCLKKKKTKVRTRDI